MSPFSSIKEIVERIVAILLPEDPPLAAAERSRVEGDVAVYVMRQIRGMPGFLRLPYSSGLIVFQLLPTLRYGRAFLSLTPLQQATWIELWSESPLLAMRDFIRLIRSSALLVFFDHPVVRQQLSDSRDSSPPPWPESSTATP